MYHCCGCGAVSRGHVDNSIIKCWSLRCVSFCIFYLFCYMTRDISNCAQTQERKSTKMFAAHQSFTTQNISQNSFLFIIYIIWAVWQPWYQTKIFHYMQPNRAVHHKPRFWIYRNIICIISRLWILGVHEQTFRYLNSETATTILKEQNLSEICAETSNIPHGKYLPRNKSCPTYLY